MAYDRADSPRVIGAAAERAIEVSASAQERPKLSVEARLEALSSELAGINGLLSGSREMVAQMKSDIVETRNGGEDPRDEEQQLIAYLEELEQARTKQKELQKELADLSKPERTELDVMGHALDRAYATHDEAKIQELEKAMLDEYEKGPIEMSKELREERAERAMTPEQKALRGFQGLVEKVEASRKILHVKPEESRMAAEELREAESEAARLLRLEADGRTIDKEALKKLQDRLPQLRERAATLQAEVAHAHQALFEDEKQAIDLVTKDPQARYALAETAKTETGRRFEALRKNPAEATKWLEETYIPEQLETQRVLPTLKDLEIEFKRRKSLQDEAGNKEYSEELFVRELKSEMSTERDRSFFKHRNVEYGKSFFPQPGGNMLAADVAAGVGQRGSMEQGRATFFTERSKYLDEVIRLFGSSSSAHGHRYFSGYDLPKHTADRLTTTKAALSEAAKKVLFSDWEGGGAFPKQRLFDRIAAEEARTAGELVLERAHQFDVIAKREKELAAQTPHVPDFAERAAAFARSQKLDEERQILMRAADRAAEEAAEPVYRKMKASTASMEGKRASLREEASRLHKEKYALEDKVRRGEQFIPDAQSWKRDAAVQALRKEESSHAEYRNEVIRANIDAGERQALEARGVGLDYTRHGIANKEYVQPFETALHQLDEELRQLGKKPDGLFTLKKTVEKWEAQYYPLNRQRSVLKNLMDKYTEEYQGAMKERIDQGEAAVAEKRKMLSQEEAAYAMSQRQVEMQRAAERQAFVAARERLTTIDREIKGVAERESVLEQEKRSEVQEGENERRAVVDAAKKAYLDQHDPKGELRAHVSMSVRAWEEQLGADVDSALKALREKPSAKDSSAGTSEAVVFSERLMRASQAMTEARAKAERLRATVAGMVDGQRGYGGYNRSLGELLVEELRSRGEERAVAAVRSLAQTESR